MLPTPEEYIARLVFLHLQGRTDEIQEKELADWRSESPSHEEIYRRLVQKAHWENSFRRFIKNEQEHEKGWNRLNARLVETQKRIRIGWWGYAAAILLSIGMGVGLLFYPGDDNSIDSRKVAEYLPKPAAHTVLTLGDGTQIDLKDELARLSLQQRSQAAVVGEGALSYRQNTDSVKAGEYHTLTVPRGAEYFLALADGSKVYLNAESKLTFPVYFGKKERRVYLEGEAYFKVEKNPQLPFIVETTPLEVEVTGTTFGIRAYQDEPQILTTLESGTVRVHQGETEVELTPDKQAVYQRGTEAIEVKEVDVELFLAWKDGRIVFDDCPLEEILTALGRWYDLEVFYAREEIRSYRFSLNIPKHESFAEVLRLLAAADRLEFGVEGNTIVVR